MTLNERLMSMDGRYKSNAGAIAGTTQPEGLSVPALWVGSKRTPLGIARYLFGMTKQRSLRFDWRSFRANSGYSNSVNKP